MSSDKYVNEGIPVLTAGKTFVLGYTNETEGIKKASEEAPVILFDDFTTDLRFIDFDFKIRSSAAKILTEQKENDIYFLFNVLKNIDYKPHDHQRHWISIFENFDVFLPSFDEQKKISSFLKIIEKKETTIKGKAEALKKYKEGTISFFIDSIDTHNIMTLDKLCSITTGKLDANAMNENGTYKFFTCSKQDYLINTYAFDAEALLISGNGDVGLCKYYKGKFNAYQRTYVLTDFKINPIYIKCCFEKQINTIVRSETNKGAMPYIRREMFSKIKIPIPETNKINECTRISSCFEDLISITESKISILEQLKNFLNKNMFI